MTENDKLQMFDDQPIRTAWNEEKEGSELTTNCSQLITICSQLKMKATDGKRRLTVVATSEQLLRIIQSIPSKKTEPFQMCLAMVGRERIEEIIAPEPTIERALDS